MAVIQDRYAGAARGLGGSSMVDLLNGWFNYRQRANEAARTEGEDPEKLAAMELDARKGLAELQKTLAQVKSGDKRAYDDVAVAAINAGSRERTAGIQAAGADKRQQLWLAGQWMEKANKEAENYLTKYEPSDKSKSQLDNIGASVHNPEGLYAGLTPEQKAEKVVDEIGGINQAEKGGGFGEGLHDNIVRRAYNSLVKAGEADAAALVAKRLLPDMQAAAGTDDPNRYFVKQYRPLDYDEANRRAEEQIRAIGTSGADPDAVNRDLARWGFDAAHLNEAGGGRESESESTTGPVFSPGSGGGGSLGFSGNLGSPGMRAVAEAYRQGADPYAALSAAIDAQSKYADEIAAQRKAALEARVKAKGPHASDFLVNPNWYVGDRQAAAVRRAGETDPGLLREEADAFARTGSVRGMNRQLQREGLDQTREFEPREYAPQNIATGGDLSGALLSNLNAQPPNAPIAGKGGWTYVVNPDLSVKVTGAPAGHKPGAVLTPGSEQWKAILNEIAPSVPALSALATLDAQPAEVRALYVNVRNALLRGDVDHAKALLPLVRAEYVRDAYGRAMQDAEDDPSRHTEIQHGIAALPESARGDWADAYGRIIDDYAATAHRGGYQSSGTSAKSTGNLGRALVSAPDVAARKTALDNAEAPANTALSAEGDYYRKGREKALDMYDSAATPEEKAAQVARWREAHKADPSDFTAGGLDAVIMRQTPLGTPTTIGMGTETLSPGRKLGDTGTVRGADLSREPEAIEPTYKAAAEPDEDIDDAGFDAFLSTKKPAATDDIDDSGFDAFLKTKQGTK